MSQTENTNLGSNRRLRHWVFTINNPRMSYRELIDTFVLMTSFRYVCFQLEVGDSGTPHYQGMVQFQNAKQFGYIKRRLPRIHLQPMRGLPHQAHAYCTKEQGRIQGPWEEGEMSGAQGERTDLTSLKQEILQGKSQKQLLVETDKYDKTLARYRHWFNMVCSCITREPNLELECWLLIGPTGTGKTRLAYNHFAAEDLFRCPLSNGTIWFDGYQSQPILLMDDFVGKASKWPLTNLLQFIDVYPIQLPVKGSYVPRNSDKIIFTTNIHPCDWYDYTTRQTQYDALARRFTKVLYYVELTDEEMESESTNEISDDISDDLRSISDISPNEEFESEMIGWNVEHRILHFGSRDAINHFFRRSSIVKVDTRLNYQQIKQTFNF